MPRLHVLCIGAHPDDCEGHIGATAALFARRGDVVRFVAVSDGSKGHFADQYKADPDALARRRRGEAQAAARIVGAEYDCMGLPDGEVYVTHANTEEMVRLIRSFGPAGMGPDLVLINRPTDYHRDHRYTAQLVLDASYMLTVPLMCPDTPHIRRMPVFAYWHDRFTEGGAFRPDVAVPVDSAIEAKIDAACQHVSQFFEWIPYNSSVHGDYADFPTDPAERRQRLAGHYYRTGETQRAQCEELLRQQGSPDDVRFVEAFQVSEYGTRPSETELRALFPLSVG